MKNLNKPSRLQSEQSQLKKNCDCDQLLNAFHEIEFLREQVASLQLALLYKEREILELELELNKTNRELCDALVQPENLTLDEAVSFAQTLVERQPPLREALAEMLTFIYSSVVQSWQLIPLQKSPDDSCPSSNSNSCRLSDSLVQLKAQSRNLKSQLLFFKTQLVRLQMMHCHPSISPINKQNNSEIWAPLSSHERQLKEKKKNSSNLPEEGGISPEARPEKAKKKPRKQFNQIPPDAKKSQKK